MSLIAPIKIKEKLVKEEEAYQEQGGFGLLQNLTSGGAGAGIVNRPSWRESRKRKRRFAPLVLDPLNLNGTVCYRLPVFDPLKYTAIFTTLSVDIFLFWIIIDGWIF